MYRQKSSAKKLLLLIIIFSLFFVGCNSVSDGSEYVSYDGSVPKVVTFLKENYLRDPESYKSVKWGKLQKHSDGCYLVTHRFSGKNAFGAYDTETLLFYISPDGQNVHICSEQQEQRILAEDKAAQFEKQSSEYIATDFSNIFFQGLFTQRIDGINEQYTLEGNLSKNDNKIEGVVTIVEQQIQYALSGVIIEDDKVNYDFKNLSTGNIIHFNGKISFKVLDGDNGTTSFQLNQN
jgi:hypothetical protein